MIFDQIPVRSIEILWQELLLQFSTDFAENSCPDEENSPLSRKQIPAHFFHILVFYQSQIHFPRILDFAEFTYK